MLIAVAVVGVAIILMLLWFVVALMFRLAVPVLDSVAAGATVAVAFPCSWLAVEMKKAREQKEVVEAIVVAKMRGGGGGGQPDKCQPSTLRSLSHQERRGCGVWWDDFFANVEGMLLSAHGSQDTGFAAGTPLG